MKIADFLHPDGWRGMVPGPLYLQLRTRIEAGIADAVVPPGASLPPEREIAALSGLSRVTVRRAIGDLVTKGLIVQRQGSGSFVTGSAGGLAKGRDQSLSYLASFSEDMARRGFVTQVNWLERGIFLPSPREQVALALAADARVARLIRVRNADGRPMALERASLPLGMLPDPMQVETSLYELLDRSGNRPVRAHQKITAVAIGETNARLLGLVSGAPGLRVERNSYNAAGEIVEFTRTLYRGDAYEFVTELRVSQE